MAASATAAPLPKEPGAPSPRIEQQRQGDDCADSRHVDRAHAARPAAVDGAKRDDDRDDRAERAADGQRDGGGGEQAVAERARPPGRPPAARSRRRRRRRARARRAPRGSRPRPPRRARTAPAAGAAAPIVVRRRSSACASRRSAPAVMPANASRRSAAELPTSSTRRARRLALRLGRDQRVVGGRQREERARHRQPLLDAPLLAQERVDAPAVYRGGRDRRAPRVVPVEERERREARGARRRPSSAAASRAAARRRRGWVCSPVSPNGTSELSVPRPTTTRWTPASSILRSGSPASWSTSQRARVQPRGQPPGGHADGAGEVVGGAELHEAAPEPHVGELDRRPDLLAREPGELAAGRAVEGAVAVGRHLARPGDAQHSLRRRQRGERVPERELLRDGAAAGGARSGSRPRRRRRC